MHPTKSIRSWGKTVGSNPSLNDPGNEIHSLLKRFINSEPVISDEKFNSLFATYKTAENVRVKQFAASEIVKGHLRLVIVIAYCYRHSGLPMDDLVSEGVLGVLDHALDHYDPAQGTRFSTYAPYWIRASITKALRRESKCKRPWVTPRKWAKGMRLQRAWDYYMTWHGGCPTDDQLLAFVRQDGKKEPISLEDVATFRNLSGLTLLSVDAILASGHGVLESGIPDVAADTETVVEARRHLERVEELISKVSEDFLLFTKNELHVIQKRILPGGTREPATLQQLGDDLDLSRERARQIEAKSFQKLLDLTDLTEEELRSRSGSQEGILRIAASI